MNNQEAVYELQYAIDLIKQDGKDWLDERDIPILEAAISALQAQEEKTQLSAEGTTSDLISRQDAIEAVEHITSSMSVCVNTDECHGMKRMQRQAVIELTNLPSAQPEIIRCEDCKHWKQQTNYQGSPLSFGFCESDDMWRSLYGETYEVAHIDTDDDHYCGYAERRTDE